MDWRVLVLVLGFLSATSGCTCAYKVADRQVVLERAIRNADVEAALHEVESVKDVHFYEERPYHVFFIFPARDPASFHFSTEGIGKNPFAGLRGIVHHFDGSPEVQITASTMNRKPTADDREEAHLLLFRIEQQLRERTAESRSSSFKQGGPLDTGVPAHLSRPRAD